MAKIPLAQLVAEQIRKQQFSLSQDTDKKLKKLFVSLLYGVPLKYSCPLPLLVDDNPSNRHEFQTLFVDAFTRDYIISCRYLALLPQLLSVPAQAIFEILFVRNENYRKVIIYPSYASGDMYGIGATMLLDASVDLRIVTDGNKGRIDRLGMIRGFVEVFIDKPRISTTRASVDSRAYVPPFDPTHPISGLKPAERNYIAWLSDDLWTVQSDAYRKHGKFVFAFDLFFGTHSVAMHFSDPNDRDAARQQVRAGWGVNWRKWPGSTAKTLATFLKSKGFVTKGGEFPKNQSVAIFWVRFTGKTGGAHVEYHTSFEGLRQLLTEAAKRGCDWAILVGDKPKESVNFDPQKKQRRVNKINDIVANSPLPTVNLTEFWTEQAWKTDFKQRTDQFKIFELLHYHNFVKHLGARSGNLESLALLGYTVRYFEDKYDDPMQALDKTRMESWHDTVGYGRIQIGSVPTRSGKYLLEKQDYYPKWTYNKRAVTPPTGTKVSGKQRPLLKPPDVSQSSTIFLSGRIEETEVVFMDTNPFQFPVDEVVPIFDVTRDFRPRTITLVTEVPERVLELPRYDKGFTSTDLMKFGSYLAPQPSDKLKNRF